MQFAASDLIIFGINKIPFKPDGGYKWGYVHTNPSSYASVFDPTKTDTNIRVHIFRSNIPFSVGDWLSSSWRQRFHPSTLIRKASVSESLHLGRRFRKPPFSRVKVSVFHRISVDDRRKRIQKYAYSNENGLVWTGPDTQPGLSPGYRAWIIIRNN